MTTNVHAEFTAEELAEQARGNQTGLMLGLISYLKSRGESIEEMSHYMGKKFLPSWRDVRKEAAIEAARWIALNMASGEGSRLHEFSGDDNRAVVRGEWVSEESLKEFDVSRDDVDTTTEIFRPIASHLGLELSWRRDSQGLGIGLSRS